MGWPRVAVREASKLTEAGAAQGPAAVFRELADARDVGELHRRVVRGAVALSGAREAQLWRPSSPGPPVLMARWPDGPAADGRLPPEAAEYPLRAGGEAFGRLVVIGPIRTDAWLEPLAIHAATCLARLEACQAVRRTIMQLVTAFSELVESRDHYTESHSLHIAELALQVGLRLGLAPEQLDQLTYAALLHDLGKIGIPDAILLKPGPLSASEWETMRQHPSIGRRALERIDLLKDAGEIIEQHHERFDGKGYPRGLAGEAIRIEARIISVVDAFDAMTTTRPYRRALSVQQAIAELRRCAGSQFDPRVVEALVGVIGEQ